jgi:hypothetical protein
MLSVAKERCDCSEEGVSAVRGNKYREDMGTSVVRGTECSEGDRVRRGRHGY